MSDDVRDDRFDEIRLTVEAANKLATDEESFLRGG